MSADEFSDDDVDFELDELSPGKKPTRKRQRLDHLTPEEKLQRRKLKNRVAAQTARDRKKARMDDLEASVRSFEKEVRKLRTENELLWKLNANLKSENESLKAAVEARKAETGELAEVKPEKPFGPAEGTGNSGSCSQVAKKQAQPPPALPLGTSVCQASPSDADEDCQWEQFDQILAELATAFAPDQVASESTGEACQSCNVDGIQAEASVGELLAPEVESSDHVYALIPEMDPEPKKTLNPVSKRRPVIRIQLPQGCTTLDLRVPDAWEELIRASVAPEPVVYEFGIASPSSDVGSSDMGYESTHSPQTGDSLLLESDISLSSDQDILMDDADFERDSFPWGDDLKLWN
jgi:hypothetical protein